MQQQERPADRFDSKPSDLRSTFAAYDLDGDGQVTRQEFQQALASLRIPSDSVDSFFDRLDVDHDGSISYEEFEAYARSPRCIFDMYDTDKSGEISRDELCQALDFLGLPQTHADTIFKRIDSDGNGSLSFDEFEAYLQQMEGELQQLFDLIDADGSGSISYRELLDAFAALRLAPDESRVHQLFDKLDADGSDEISYQEFKSIFALLQPVDLIRFYDPSAQLFELGGAEFLSDMRLALGRYQPRPLAAAAKPATQQQQWGDGMRMALGGLSAVVAQLVCQPIETVKVRLQNEAGLAGAAKRYGSFTRGFAVVAREEGLRGLYKGMAPSTLRELSYSTLRFGLYKPIKDAVGRLGPQPPAGAKPPPEPLWKKLLAGGAAGGIGSAISNPTDLLKARMQADHSTNPTSMLDHCRHIMRSDGVRGFWKGTSTTVTRAVILGSTKLASYDEIKTQLHTRLQLDPKGWPCTISASVGAGLLVSITSAPADFARTRYMTAAQMAKQTGVPVEYTSGLDVIRKVVAKEGPMAVYKGFLPQWARIAPYSILQFLAWEEMCKIVGLDTV